MSCLFPTFLEFLTCQKRCTVDILNKIILGKVLQLSQANNAFLSIFNFQNLHSISPCRRPRRSCTNRSDNSSSTNRWLIVVVPMPLWTDNRIVRNYGSRYHPPPTILLILSIKGCFCSPLKRWWPASCSDFLLIIFLGRPTWGWTKHGRTGPWREFPVRTTYRLTSLSFCLFYLLFCISLITVLFMMILVIIYYY